jgi:hypothetical protein
MNPVIFMIPSIRGLQLEYPLEYKTARQKPSRPVSQDGSKTPGRGYPPEPLEEAAGASEPSRREHGRKIVFTGSKIWKI